MVPLGRGFHNTGSDEVVPQPCVCALIVCVCLCCVFQSGTTARGEWEGRWSAVRSSLKTGWRVSAAFPLLRFAKMSSHGQRTRALRQRFQRTDSEMCKSQAWPACFGFIDVCVQFSATKMQEAAATNSVLGIPNRQDSNRQPTDSEASAELCNIRKPSTFYVLQ